MLDVLVELAIRWGDWYTAGLFAVPLAGLALAVKLRPDSPETAAGLALVSVVLALVAAPGYFRARDECRRLVEAGRPRPGDVVIENGSYRYTDQGNASRESRYAALRQECYSLVR